jgi:glycosyltransferase involved in cell wall biosynthesis
MSAELDFIVPGDPAQLTGGYLYDAHIVDELRALGWRVRVHGLRGCFPQADDEARCTLESTLATLPVGRTVVIDGLALGGLPDIALAHSGRLALVALVHHPLADEHGLDTVVRRCLLASERAALSAARLAITTSAHTAARLADFGVQRDRVRVVEPGVLPMPLAAADGEPPRLLCVASLTPRKAQDVLVEALARVRTLRWQCDLVGSTTRDPAFAASVAQRIIARGLQARITLRGECDLDALRAAYTAADLFVLPSHYEGYGMVIDEAIGAGLPVLATTGGALAATLPAPAGLGVPPGDAGALAEALRLLLADRPRRLALRDGARRAREGLRSWAQAGSAFAAALRSGIAP